jgi:hypothetical protein
MHSYTRMTHPGPNVLLMALASRASKAGSAGPPSSTRTGASRVAFFRCLRVGRRTLTSLVRRVDGEDADAAAEMTAQRRGGRLLLRLLWGQGPGAAVSSARGSSACGVGGGEHRRR